MAEILGTKGSSVNILVGRRVGLVNAGSPVFDVLAITENSTIGPKTPPMLAVTASGANRDLAFLSTVEVNGGFQLIYNAGSTYSIVVKSSAPATLLTLAPGELVALVYDSTAWAVLWKVTASGLPTIAPTQITLTDNSATALQFLEGANPYLTFNTTNSGEQVVVAKPLHHAGGIATASRFTSTEQTGTGSSQNVAHGLGSTPSMVWFSVSEDPAGTGFDVTPGAHDATNCVFTVTAGVKYYVFALK